ncbi:MAG TPA: enoyl-CoA hydratase-related protein [Acidimicrobiales bacterium]|nr:enoyl-CoA hydratase-related protein [Acidimicrobiales bacterium]
MAADEQGNGVATEISENVITLRFDRVAKKNAITSDMYRALADGLARLESDDGIRVGVLRAEGPDFCAGNDLYDFLSPTTDPDEDVPVTRFLRSLAVCSKPLVAAVRGRAIGVGATMLLHCDFVYVSADAQLRFPFVDLGVVPEAGSTMLLPRLVGRRLAAEAFLLCRPLNAEQAVQYGIANAVVEDVDAEASLLLDELLDKPPGALLATRRLMRGDPSELLARIDAEDFLFRAQLTSPEFASALDNFGRRGKSPA